MPYLFFHKKVKSNYIFYIYVQVYYLNSFTFNAIIGNMQPNCQQTKPKLFLKG